MTEPILVIIALIILGGSLVYIIKQVTDYYESKYHFSLWAGVLLFSVALIALALIAGAAHRATIDFLYLVAFGLLGFTLYRDISLSNAGMGLLAFVLQFLLSISLFAIILVVIARWIMNKVLGKKPYYSINPGIAIGLNTGEPFRHFFTLTLNRHE